MPLYKRLLRAAGAIIVILYLVFMPGRLTKQTNDPKMHAQQRATNGVVIDVWHIAGFKPWSGSMSNWLEKQAKKVEDKNFGVFYRVTAMSLEECSMRVARGESADMYSFPLGWGYAERFMPLAERPELSKDMRERGRYQGKCYAVPFAASAYALIKNENSPGGVCVTAYPVAAVYAAIECEIAEAEAFREGKQGAALGDLRLAGDCQRALTAGKGFSVSFQPATEYTDMVQFAAIARDCSEEKQKWATALIERLLGLPAQQSLLAQGLLPLVRHEQLDLSETADQLTPFFELKLIVPNAFAYNQQFDALKEAAERALAGDSEARKDFDERIKALVMQG